MALRLGSGGLLFVRIAGALWFLLEWLIMMTVMIATFVAVFTDGELTLEGDDSPMRFIDWIDAGTFTIWSVILLSAPLAVAVGLFMNLRGELSGWVRKLCFAVIAGNVLGAVWWWISFSDGEAFAMDLFVSVGMLFTAAVASIMAISAPRSPQPAFT